MTTPAMTHDERRKECTRRKHECLMYDDEAIDEIAERAAQKAVEKMTNDLYRGIGRGVVTRLTTVVGVISVAAYLWAQGKGIIK